MGKIRREGNYTSQKKKFNGGINWEMKKMDTQFLTATKQ
jgi:hypothetical protein